MKKLTAAVLATLMLLSLAACGAGQPAAPQAAAPGPTAEQPEKVAATEEPMATEASALTDAPAATEEPAAEKPVSPYAWLGYGELPQCRYFDIMATGVFYREYDSYISGYSLSTVQASDGVNTYQSDGGNISLNLNGMVYSLSVRSKQYMQKDMTAAYQSTLATQNENRVNGVDTTGKEFAGTGAEPVPLLSDGGDSASYEYYEFTSEQLGMTLRERIYFKDGDVYAIHQLVTVGESTTELTEVIRLVSAEPDPALFTLPADFDEYTPIG